MTYKHLNPVNGIIIANKKDLDLLALISLVFTVLTAGIIIVDFCVWKLPIFDLRCIIAFYIVSLSANFHCWKDINKTN